MGLNFELREALRYPLEMQTLTPGQPASLTAATAQRARVLYGSGEVELGELFRVETTEEAPSCQRWQGDLSRVKRLAEGMLSGQVHVTGSLGMHAGAMMSGGRLEIVGDVAEWCGAHLAGGHIVVRGNAGNQLGAAYRGSRRGMMGGEILVTGNAGAETGAAMRRGLIAIVGDCGDMPGFGMLAGTICIGGRSGQAPGAGMKRGTIVLGDSSCAERLLPTFRHTGRIESAWWALQRQHLRAIGWAPRQPALFHDMIRYCGDLIGIGKGEILLPAI